MFAFMLYILLEVTAYFSIMVGSAYPREIIHGAYMLGRYLLRILVKVEEGK